MKNILIYTVGNFSSKLLVFIMLPVYTYYLTVNEYGQFDLIVTIVSLLLPIVSFQMSEGIYRYLLDAKSEEDQARVITNGLLVVIRNVAIFSAVFACLNFFVDIEYFFLIEGYLLALVLSTVYLQIARGLKRNLEFAIAGIVSTIANVSMNVILIIVLHLKVEALLISVITTSVTIVLYIEMRVKVLRFIKFKLIARDMTKILTLYSLPLIPNLINWWVMNASDRLVLNFFIGFEANGIYAVATRFATIIMVINQIFYLSWQETSITEYNSKDRNAFYSRMFDKFMKFQFSGLFGLLAFSFLLIEYFIDGDFKEAYYYMPPLFIAMMFSSFSSFYGTGFQSAKETKGAFYSSIAGSVCNMILNVILVPLIGIMGSAVSNATSFFVMWVLRIYQTRKYFSITIDYKALGSLFILLAGFLVIYYSNVFALKIAAVIAAPILFLFLNNWIVKSVFRKIKFSPAKEKL